MEHVSKSYLMSRVAKGLNHECFNHSEAGGFDVTRIREKAREMGGQIVLIGLEDIIHHIYTSRDTEPARVMQLTEESWRDDPGIFIELKEENGSVSHLMIDGHHRALRRAIEGLETMRVWLIPFSEAMRPSALWIPSPHHTWGDEKFMEKVKCK